MCFSHTNTHKKSPHMLLPSSGHLAVLESAVVVAAGPVGGPDSHSLLHHRGAGEQNCCALPPVGADVLMRSARRTLVVTLVVTEFRCSTRCFSPMNDRSAAVCHAVQTEFGGCASASLPGLESFGHRIEKVARAQDQTHMGGRRLMYMHDGSISLVMTSCFVTRGNLCSGVAASDDILSLASAMLWVFQHGSCTCL